jgi:methyltransferase (TIGR00027 family)
MHEGQPSRTAERVAVERAAHQLLDSPLVLEDPLAIRVISAEHRAALQEHAERHDRSPMSKPTRAIVVVRTRIAEDQLARTAAPQYVVLGAGLDTFAYRNSVPHLRVYEVDFPATQNLKRERLNAAGIEVPENMSFVPCDFARDQLADVLDAAGFNRAEPAVFAWLGVVMYLEHANIVSTLRYIAAQSAPASVVFDYAQPPDIFPWLQRVFYRRVLDRLAELGEPWKSFMQPEPLRTELLSLGFASVEDLGGDEINARYLGNRSDGLKARSIGRIAIARR